MEHPILSKITIANYRSIFSPQTINLNTNNSKTFALYGQNATGKSNTLKALQTIAEIIIYSSDAKYQLPYHSFHYSASDVGQPTIFEIEINSENHTLRYLFAYNATKIVYEELKIKSNNTNKYKTLFSRDIQNNLNPSAVNYGFSKQLLRRTLPRTLLLTKAYEDNNPYAKFIFNAINKIKFVSLDSKQIERIASEILDNSPTIRKKVSDKLSEFEPSIKDIQTTKINIHNQAFEKLFSDLNTPYSQIPIFYTDLKISRKYGSMEFLENISDESSGIRTIIAVLTMMQYSIENDLMLCIDEFGNYLHPHIAAKILNYYENLNPTKQLLITTHLLGLYDHIGRAERIIVQKNQKTGETFLEQRKATLNQRILKKEKKEAEEYFINHTNKGPQNQLNDTTFLYNLLKRNSNI